MKRKNGTNCGIGSLLKKTLTPYVIAKNCWIYLSIKSREYVKYLQRSEIAHYFPLNSSVLIFLFS